MAMKGPARRRTNLEDKKSDTPRQAAKEPHAPQLKRPLIPITQKETAAVAAVSLLLLLLLLLLLHLKQLQLQLQL